MCMNDPSSSPGWRRSRYCGESSACVEVHSDGEYIALRDSANPNGAVLVFDRTAWRAFVEGIQAGELEGL
jgi:hypothetical protein